MYFRIGTNHILCVSTFDYRLHNSSKICIHNWGIPILIWIIQYRINRRMREFRQRDWPLEEKSSSEQFLSQLSELAVKSSKKLNEKSMSAVTGVHDSCRIKKSKLMNKETKTSRWNQNNNAKWFNTFALLIKWKFILERDRKNQATLRISEQILSKCKDKL